MGRHRRSAAGRAATGRATTAGHTDGSAPGERPPLDPPAAGRPTMGTPPVADPRAYAEVRAKADAYLFGTEETAQGAPAAAGPASRPAGAGDGFTPGAGPRSAGTRRRRKKRAVTPVRTGLLGVSAAVAIGAVAVTTGAVPGLDNYRLGGGSGGGRVQSADLPSNTPAEQGGTTGSAESEESAAAGPGTAAPRLS
ncbi:CAP domain-containing protein, partial [Streptomyces sp. PRKS01-65]|nr:CAP domain-containing protein [Streptomyces harenosi]